jgi:uncharacterized membrane protein
MISLIKAAVARVKKNSGFNLTEALKLPVEDLAYVVLLDAKRRHAQLVFSFLIMGSGLLTLVFDLIGPAVLATAGCYLIAGLFLLDVIVVWLNLRRGRRFVRKAIERNKRRQTIEYDKEQKAEAWTAELMSRWNRTQP